MNLIQPENIIGPIQACWIFEWNENHVNFSRLPKVTLSLVPIEPVVCETKLEMLTAYRRRRTQSDDIIFHMTLWVNWSFKKSFLFLLSYSIYLFIFIFYFWAVEIIIIYADIK